MNILKNYIGGSWVDSASKKTIDVLNPANQEVLAKVPFGSDTKKDIGEATVHAQKAFKEWSKVPVMKRVQVLYHLKSLLEENTEVIAEIITNESGKDKRGILG